ncbi:hypothetical protein FQR65_LT10408 [Abscondita terminalis]|nr:hypothetical protein FQR65_LT10408 [Abscondita terminalis]
MGFQNEKLHKNRNLRHDALMGIANQFNMEKQAVEQKIKNLQSQFSKELKKIKHSKKSGTGTEDVYTSKWFAFESLKFLLDKNKPREMLDSELQILSVMDAVDDANDVDATDDLENTYHCILNDENNSSQDSTMSNSQANDVEKAKDNVTPKKQFKSPTLAHVPSRKRRFDDSMVNEAYEAMKQTLAANKPKDVFTICGEEVAVTLRNLPTTYAQAIVQHKITTKSKYNLLPEEATEIGELLLFLDELFDSLNANSKTAPHCKPMKGAITKKVRSSFLLAGCNKMLESLRFCTKVTNKLCKDPSVVNLVKTMRGFMNLSRSLLQKVDYALPRASNQDCFQN